MTRVVFMGSPEFAQPSLEGLVNAGYEIVGVYTQPDREAGRGRTLTPPPVKQRALELGLPVFQPSGLRREAALAELRTLAPDVIVVAAFGQILRTPVLTLPPAGVLNVHASLLPRWRGASPIQAAILAGDRETGVSIMLLDEGLDTGPVLARRSLSIGPRDTAGSLSRRLAEDGADLLIETLPAWLADPSPNRAAPQDAALATYAPRVDKEAGRLDWCRPAGDIWLQVRAYNPWPSAVTSLHGQPLRIHEAWPLPSSAGRPPGTVVSLDPALRDLAPPEAPRAAFGVQCGEGLLAPLVLQRAGKRPLFAEEFLRGEHGLIGTALG